MTTPHPRHRRPPLAAKSTSGRLRGQIRGQRATSTRTAATGQNHQLARKGPRDMTARTPLLSSVRRQRQRQRPQKRWPQRRRRRPRPNQRHRQLRAQRCARRRFRCRESCPTKSWFPTRPRGVRDGSAPSRLPRSRTFPSSKKTSKSKRRPSPRKRRRTTSSTRRWSTTTTSKRSRAAKRNTSPLSRASLRHRPTSQRRRAMSSVPRPCRATACRAQGMT
mmetsp:Transcript_39578/g.109048  ORF Transcript_39578/g.109048 Transcript_39578/m.109048 type:complete len:220 (+) Transcript_39578:282-941(+)